MLVLKTLSFYLAIFYAIDCMAAPNNSQTRPLRDARFGAHSSSPRLTTSRDGNIRDETTAKSGL